MVEKHSRRRMHDAYKKAAYIVLSLGAHIALRPSRHVLSRALLVDSDHILLMRQLGGLSYNLPGGHVDGGESIQNAVERECFEECGVRLKAEKVLGIVEMNYKKLWFLKKQTLTFVWKMNHLAMDEKVYGREYFEKPEWVRLSDLQNLDLRPAILKQWIPEWIKTDQIIFHPTVPVHFW